MIIIDDLICLFEDGDKDSPPETPLDHTRKKAGDNDKERAAQMPALQHYS